MTKTITIAYGDGIGPEIMEATLRILKEAEADLNFSVIDVGEKIYKKGFNSGFMPSAYEDLENSRVLLKAPITTPQGGGYKSLNVTLRKKLGLFANVRPIRSFYPFVDSKFDKIDLTIIRENEEDCYIGVEHRQSLQSYQCLKLYTKEGCEKIIRYAFEYALKNNRKKVSCFSKDNIMKMTDGLFHKTFDEISQLYPDIKTDHFIIDIGTAKIANKPEDFDVVVTSNLYGDIISDVAAEISGSVGLAGSANIGNDYAMFEAIHGSAPDIAGKDIANPTGLINGAIMMLNHISQYEVANKIANALYKTIEEGIHTADIYNQKTSKKKVGTKEFTDHLIKNLGQVPSKLTKAEFKAPKNNIKQTLSTADLPKEQKLLIGFDLFIDWQDEFENLVKFLKKMESENLEIKNISSKGLILWPLTDKHMMPNNYNGLTVLRFIGKNIVGKVSNQIINDHLSIAKLDIINMLEQLNDKGIDFVKYEGLYTFDGKAGYTSIQGE